MPCVLKPGCVHSTSLPGGLVFAHSEPLVLPLQGRHSGSAAARPHNTTQALGLHDHTIADMPPKAATLQCTACTDWKHPSQFAERQRGRSTRKCRRCASAASRSASVANAAAAEAATEATLACSTCELVLPRKAFAARYVKRSDRKCLTCAASTKSG